MKLSICTISFRHQLISIEQLASWAQGNHFQGIELWGVHAENLAEQPGYGKNWLRDYGLETSMISDYLPLQAPEQLLFDKVQLLSQLAKHWGAKKIRTFAGDKSSAETSPEERKRLAKTLRKVCKWLAPHELTLIVETHPHTFADTVDSTQQLIEEVAQENLKLNFDVLHIWESKADIMTAVDKLEQHINHFHLKNITSEDYLAVFSPPNVYSASGSREGIVELFNGAVNYHEFLEYIHSQPRSRLAEVDASLEWFGNQCQQTLKHDRYLINQLQQRCNPAF